MTFLARGALKGAERAMLFGGVAGVVAGAGAKTTLR